MTTAEKLTAIAENEQKVYEAGKKSEYDTFWDTYQNSGEAMDYSYSFAGINWDDDNYNPKYPIKCTVCTNMFRNSIITDTKVDIDLSTGTGTYVLANCRNLVRVPKLIVNENVVYTGWFTSCTALKEIRFEGTIANDLDVRWSTGLSADSLKSIVDCLYQGEGGITVSLPAASEATYNAEYGDGAWAALVASRPYVKFVYA